METGKGGMIAGGVGAEEVIAGGVIAGGHPATTEAGLEILRRGGNAADAAVAACCTAVAAEAALTGLGAGGFALVRHPDSESELIDFFVTAPGRGRSPDAGSLRSPLPRPHPAVQCWSLFLRRPRTSLRLGHPAQTSRPTTSSGSGRSCRTGGGYRCPVGRAAGVSP